MRTAPALRRPGESVGEPAAAAAAALREEARTPEWGAPPLTWVREQQPPEGAHEHADDVEREVRGSPAGARGCHRSVDDQPDGAEDREPLAGVLRDVSVRVADDVLGAGYVLTTKSWFSSLNLALPPLAHAPYTWASRRSP